MKTEYKIALVAGLLILAFVAGALIFRGGIEEPKEVVLSLYASKPMNYETLYCVNLKEHAALRLNAVCTTERIVSAAQN